MASKAAGRAEHCDEPLDAASLVLVATSRHWHWLPVEVNVPGPMHALSGGIRWPPSDWQAVAACSAGENLRLASVGRLQYIGLKGSGAPRPPEDVIRSRSCPVAVKGPSLRPSQITQIVVLG